MAAETAEPGSHANPMGSGRPRAPDRVRRRPDSACDADLNRLLARAAEGDLAAFRQLYDRTSGRLMAFAVRLVGDRSTAEEVLQDAFVEAWRGARTFRVERGNALGWLSTIVRYRAYDRLRRRCPPAGEMAGDVPDDRPTAVAGLERLAERSLIRRCLDALDQVERTGLLLAFYEGASHSAIARRLALPLGTVKSRIRRALIKMRTCLDETDN